MENSYSQLKTICTCGHTIYEHLEYVANHAEGCAVRACDCAGFESATTPPHLIISSRKFGSSPGICVKNGKLKLISMRPPQVWRSVC